MQRLTLSLLFTTSLVASGCSFSFSASTKNKSKNPDGSGDGDGQGQSDGDGGGASDGSKQPRGRDSASTSGVGRRTSGKRIKPSAPPHDDTDTGEPADDLGDLTVTGFAPTAAAAGTLIEVYGDGFGTDATKLKVVVSGVTWPVEQVLGDRIIVKVPAAAKSGEMSVKRGKKTAKVPGAFTLLVDDGGIVQPVDTMNGLIGEVFDLGGQVSGLPDFSTLGAPAATIVVANLDVPVRNFEQGFPAVGKNLLEWFAIRFTGSLNVTEGGEYELCLNSDDGSKLFLEDTLVVDNDGLHSATQKCEIVYLEAGEYGIRVEYFQGPATEIALQLLWAKDGGALAPVPSDVLFRPDAMDPNSGNNNGE
jgi:hypothetical protein